MSDLRIGIIGTGMIAHRHMTIWSNIPGTKVVAACDIYEEKVNKFGEQYGIPKEDLYVDFREMLKRTDIDAIDVCVHNNLHTPVSVAVMKAGFPCYSEKPMAGSYADAKILYDAQKKYGQKLAVQISSLFNPQTRLAKKFIEEGKLGKIYHARSVGHRRQGRPGYDMFAFSEDFISKEVGGHGPIFDLGIYHLAQMLYVMGMPELESVYGVASADYWQDARIPRKFEVEDLGVALARFKGGISMDIYEDWAIHMDEVGTSFIAGSLGGLKFSNVDASGGPLAVRPGGRKPAPPTLDFYGLDGDSLISVNYGGAVDDMNGRQEAFLNPGVKVYNDNQVHWVAYLKGELDDTTRIDTPYIAMQTALLSEGIFLSSELGRSVTADEIKAMSKSTAIRVQKTPWGEIEYDF